MKICLTALRSILFVIASIYYYGESGAAVLASQHEICWLKRNDSPDTTIQNRIYGIYVASSRAMSVLENLTLCPYTPTTDHIYKPNFGIVADMQR